MPAIGAVRPVVAHNEILVPHERKFGVFQAEIRRQPAQVRLYKSVAVNKEHALCEFHALTRQSYDALHVPSPVRCDNNDIASLRRSR